MPLGATYVDGALDGVTDSWPSSGATYRLYASDPTLATLPGDVELTSAGGYASVAFAPADFTAGVGSLVDFGTSTDAYSDVATYWGIVDGSDLLVFSDDLSDPIEVDAASTAVSFTPTLSFADGE